MSVLAARVRAELGAPAGSVAVIAPGAGRLAARLRDGLQAPDDGGPPAGAVVSFLCAPGDPAVRQAVLAALRRRLAPGAPVVVVDHNRPRRWLRRVLGAAVLVARGRWPSRATYPAARELAALGFGVERLRLAAGERVQIVVARRPETA